jgi:mono/diheme cytochrome c family protein
MKKLLTILGTVVLLVIAGAATGEVVIKKEQLEYKDVKDFDGATLYNNLCAVCHGVEAKGDGPAAPALKMEVPDLTMLSAANGGVFPRKAVMEAISGKRRVIAHGTVDMPVWGDLMESLRPDWTLSHRKAFAKERMATLTTHVESIQATN